MHQVCPGLRCSFPVPRPCRIRRGYPMPSTWFPSHMWGVGQVTAGDVVNRRDRDKIQRALDLAREISGLCFAVYLGDLPNERESAIAAHARLADPESSVLVAVDPNSRIIEIITGTTAAYLLDDRSCELGAFTMRSSFQADDLAGGIRDGLLLLAEHARAPKVLHLDDPA